MAQNSSSVTNRTLGRGGSTNAAAIAFIPIGGGQPKSSLEEICDDNLCFNGGSCDPVTQKCKCTGHFIGTVVP